MRRLERLFDRYRRRGDVAALARVFDRTAPEVLRVAMHLARQPAEAEDLVQETFLTAIERAEGYDSTRPLVPWLLGILRNHARHVRRPRALMAVDAVADRPVADPEPVDAIPWSETVSAAIATLPTPYREVLVLRLRHGLEPAEIALAHGVPPATVRSHLHRGLERLRRALPSSAAAFAAFPPPRGLASVRAEVLARATTHATSTGAAAAAGGLLVAKKTTIAAAALLALGLGGGGAWIGGAFRAGPNLGGAPLASPDDESPPTAPALAAAAPTEAPSDAVDAEAGRAPTADATHATAPADPATGVVVGRLRFRDGRPLRDVPVASSIGRRDARVVRTDSEGAFRLDGVYDGSHPIVIREERFQVILGNVDVRPGRVARADLDVDPGVAVEGVVVDEQSGAPLGDLRLTVRRPGVLAAQANYADATTDEGGRYRLDLLPRTAYTVEAQRAGYQPTLFAVDLAVQSWPSRLALPRARRWIFRLGGLDAAAVGKNLSWSLQRAGGAGEFLLVEGRGTIGADRTVVVDAPMPGAYYLQLARTEWTPEVSRTIDVPTGDVPDLLLPMAVAVGRVAGTLRDGEGAPVAGVRVLVGAASGETDAEGRFAIDRAPIGDQEVRISNSVDTSTTVDTATVAPSGTTTLTLRAPSGSLVGTLLCDGAPMPRYGGLGIFLDEWDPTMRRVAETRAREDGAFELRWIPPGSYRLTLWGGDQVPQVRRVTVGAGDRVDVGTVDLERFLDVPLRVSVPDGNVPSVYRLAAVDAETGRTAGVPLEGGLLWGLQPRVFRDERGLRFGGLAPGSYRITFEANGFRPAEVTVTIRRGQDTPIDVRLERP